ncbi:hypothetical protein SAMN05216223_11594 [Actinacidiphila yanglinensis]|uniref:Uncharacterized protein n=1 Tax=Actinacidiphila yanglinensis TaxID=310779 RepID=A0A1H6DIP8_9ACTN|nr:hypothetical protein SAMN05216223_11594 [Actinacidiphila yanglinensis]
MPGFQQRPRVVTAHPTPFASLAMAVCQAGRVEVSDVPAVSAGSTTLDQAVASLNLVFDQPVDTSSAAVLKALLTSAAKYASLAGFASHASPECLRGPRYEADDACCSDGCGPAGAGLVLTLNTRSRILRSN